MEPGLTLNILFGENFRGDLELNTFKDICIFKESG